MFLRLQLRSVQTGLQAAPLIKPMASFWWMADFVAAGVLLTSQPWCRIFAALMGWWARHVQGLGDVSHSQPDCLLFTLQGTGLEHCTHLYLTLPGGRRFQAEVKFIHLFAWYDTGRLKIVAEYHVSRKAVMA